MNAAKKITVVSSSRALQRHVTRALVSAGNEVTRCPVDRSQLELALNEPQDMFLIDAESDEREIFWLIDELYRHHAQTIPLILSNDLRNRLLFELLEQRGLNNLVARHGGMSATSDFVDEQELIVTCYKLFHRDILGLEKYLSTYGIRIQERTIRKSSDKLEALSELMAFLQRLDCYGAIVPAVSLVADELLTNAVYNAPRDNQGQPKYASRDRRCEVDLEASEEVLFRYGCDGRYVALSVADKFGSLDRKVIVKYLENVFSDQRAVTECKEGGAGIGLYMVLNSITQLTFNIMPGRCTEVIALFYIREGARVFRTAGRSLNIFLLQP